MKRLMLIVPVFTILVVLRIIFNENDYKDLIIAIVNIISLIVVVSDCLDSFFKNQVREYQKYPKQIADREIKKNKLITFSFLTIVFSVCSVLYIVKFISPLVNDIISIVAIVFSLIKYDILDAYFNRKKENERNG